jgi:two-component system, cell cycle response regulator CtrA
MKIDQYRDRLTGKEFAILELLAANAGKTVTKAAILSHLYGGLDEPEMKIIDVFVCKLRRKIGSECIETVWGRGYAIIDPATERKAS